MAQPGPAWPGPVAAITLVTDDLVATRQFYLDVFGLPVFYQDDSSTVFRFGETLVNLLAAAAAPELFAPAPVGSAASDRSVLTVEVDDVDARVEQLRTVGVELLNGPVDRPWGIRTASFRDPSGQVWEVSGPPSG